MKEPISRTLSDDEYFVTGIKDYGSFIIKGHWPWWLREAIGHGYIYSIIFDNCTFDLSSETKP